ncbi:hypothetical protein [Moorena sp. SIO3I6]|nr:hypothetical protein [Moorena sp. SIO3I6]
MTGGFTPLAKKSGLISVVSGMPLATLREQRSAVSPWPLGNS